MWFIARVFGVGIPGKEGTVHSGILFAVRINVTGTVLRMPKTVELLSIRDPTFGYKRCGERSLTGNDDRGCGRLSRPLHVS